MKTHLFAVNHQVRMTNLLKRNTKTQNLLVTLHGEAQRQITNSGEVVRN